MKWVMVVVAAVALVGCAEQVSATNPCVIGNSRYVPDSPQATLSMSVASTADKCSIYVGRGIGAVPDSIVSKPTHGTAEIENAGTGQRVNGLSAAVGFAGNMGNEVMVRGAVYRPLKGYVGTDEFAFTLAPAYGSTFRVMVNVVPAAKPQP